MKKLHLEIITPEKVVFTDEVDMVVVPGIEGDLGILPGHVPLFTKVRAGELMVRKSDSQTFLAITGGFVEVLGDKVNVLADYAVRAEEVEVARVEEAKKRAEKLMEERTTKQEFAIAQAELQKALLELKVARRKKVRI